MSGLQTIDTMATATGSRRAARVTAAFAGFAPAGVTATTAGHGAFRTFDIKRHGWMNRPRGPGGGS